MSIWEKADLSVWLAFNRTKDKTDQNMIFLFLFLLGFVDGGGHLDRPWFRWRDGVIPFTFQQIDALDREVVKDTMALIEQRTCLRFQERSFAPSGHRLVVQGAKKSCLRAADGVPT